jgi:alkaline phosphatase
MNNLIRACICTLVVLFPTACISLTPQTADAPRNVIFMLGDGMGYAHIKAYRMYADDPATDIVEPLPVDALLVGAVSTDSISIDCDALKLNCKRDPHGFTDSASSATAYATGHDTITGRLSVDTEGAPMETVLEAARKQGKSTGLVATSQVVHASPAAFASHVMSRRSYNDIADQLFDIQWQDKPMASVILGGGLQYLQREDRDLVSEFREAGYQVANNREEMLNMQGERLLGLFAPVGLPKAWDRDQTLPSLAEMTQTALSSLAKGEQGFFLMIEGSQIDWASHGNSIPGVISEMEDFMGAVQVALDFAQKDQQTLVVILADHETGGMAVGRDGAYRWNSEPLKGLKATPSGIIERMLAGDEALSAIVADSIAFKLSPEEIEMLDTTEREEREAFAAVAGIFNERTFTGWTSGGHTGVDVPLYAFGPGSNHFHGVMQNEDVGKTLREVFLPSK